MNISLHRVPKLSPLCNLGCLIVDDRMVFATLELLWRENKRNVSCIPTGRYTCEWTDSPKFGKVWMVKDVPNRGHILFHSMNKPSQTRGCIGLGMDFTHNPPRLRKSRKAMGIFHEMTANEKKLYLEIVEEK